MPYRYVLKWRKGYEEMVSVEAWPKTKDLALQNEMKRPSFMVGKLVGSRTIMIRQLVEEAIRRFGSSKRGMTTRVDFPKDDVSAIATAYRIGLLAAILAEIRDSDAAEHAYEYVMRATQEEIWFWASKMLGVIDQHPRKRNVINALVALAHP